MRGVRKEIPPHPPFAKGGIIAMQLRLTVHAGAAQVTPVEIGIPWLGFVVYPTHRRVKARNVRNFTQRLQARWEAYCDGEISFAEFDASVAGLDRACALRRYLGLARARAGTTLAGSVVPLKKSARSALRALLPLRGNQ